MRSFGSLTGVVVVLGCATAESYEPEVTPGAGNAGSSNEHAGAGGLGEASGAGASSGTAGSGGGGDASGGAASGAGAGGTSGAGAGGRGGMAGAAASGGGGAAGSGGRGGAGSGGKGTSGAGGAGSGGKGGGAGGKGTTGCQHVPAQDYICEAIETYPPRFFHCEPTPAQQPSGCAVFSTSGTREAEYCCP